MALRIAVIEIVDPEIVKQTVSVFEAQSEVIVVFVVTDSPCRFGEGAQTWLCHEVETIAVVEQFAPCVGLHA